MVLQHLDFLRQKRILLASASPRRREILAILGLQNLNVCFSSFAEDLPKTGFTCGGDYALCTARRKAEFVLQRQQQQQQEKKQRQDDISAPADFDVLIAADTVVTMPLSGGGIAIIEKPATSEEAAAMMRRFSGRRHDVWSGVVLVVREGESGGGGGDELRWREIKVRTTVEFASMAEEEIIAYVAKRSNWEGKAGGYGIQDTAACFITAIDGDYYNVMGLPLQALCAEIDWFISEGVLR